MSETFDVHLVNLPLGAFNGATEVPLVQLPQGFGAISVLDAWLPGLGAGTTIGGKIVTFGSVASGGTPAINGTVGTFAGTVVLAAGVVNRLTISDAVVDDSEWMGFDQTSGTVPAGTYITLAYVMGK